MIFHVAEYRRIACVIDREAAGHADNQSRRFARIMPDAALID